MNAHETGTRIIKIVRDRFGVGFVWGMATSLFVMAGAFCVYVFVLAPAHDDRLAKAPPEKPPSVPLAPKLRDPEPMASPPDDASALSPVTPRWATRTPFAGDKPKGFDLPKSLKKRVNFWQRVWQKVPEHVHLLVDSRRPWVIHKTVTCTKGQKRNKPCQQKIAKASQGVRKTLKKLARRPTRRHRRAYSNDKKLMRTAATSVMRVSGKKDALDRAMVRAGDQLFLAEQVFVSVGLPKELSRVAFVESLYRADATSRAGAIGAYQFMAVTAREYITVTEDIDERRDPERAAYAAARYLKTLQKKLRRWSLATTAYNTGPTRMTRLTKKHRTQDLGVLIENVKDSRFGFDGQNYYAQLLGVVRATAKLKSLDVKPRQTVRLSRAVSFKALAEQMDVSEKALARANPALRPPITQGREPVPVSYIVNVPQDGPVVSEATPDEGAKGT